MGLDFGILTMAVGALTGKKGTAIGVGTAARGRLLPRQLARTGRLLDPPRPVRVALLLVGRRQPDQQRRDPRRLRSPGRRRTVRRLRRNDCLQATRPPLVTQGARTSRALLGVAARSLAATETTITLVQYRALVSLASGAEPTEEARYHPGALPNEPRSLVRQARTRWGSADCGSRVQRRGQPGMEYAPAGAGRGGYQGQPREPCGQGTAMAYHGADHADPGQQLTGPHIDTGSALPVRLGHMGHAPAHGRGGDKLDDRTEDGQTARRTVLALSRHQQSEPCRRSRGGADEHEGHLTVGVVPGRHGRVAQQRTGVGGDRRADDGGADPVAAMPTAGPRPVGSDAATTAAIGP